MSSILTEGNTFAACGLEAERATSGRNLLELVAEKKSGIITTLIHKFDKAFAKGKGGKQKRPSHPKGNGKGTAGHGRGWHPGKGHGKGGKGTGKGFNHPNASGGKGNGSWTWY